jgi:hypothetical protein
VLLIACFSELYSFRNHTATRDRIFVCSTTLKFIKSIFLHAFIAKIKPAVDAAYSNKTQTSSQLFSNISSLLLSIVQLVYFFIYLLFFLFSLLVGGGVRRKVHAALRPVIGLLYLSRAIVRMEKLVE